MAVHSSHPPGPSHQLWVSRMKLLKRPQQDMENTGSSFYCMMEMDDFTALRHLITHASSQKSLLLSG